MSSLNWFKSQKKKEMEDLQVEEQKLKNKILEKQLITRDAPSESLPEEKPILKSLRLVNDVLTVVMSDGSVITKSEATAEDFKNVKYAKDEDELLLAFYSKKGIEDRHKFEQEIKEVTEISNGFPSLTKSGDFVVEDGCVYLKEMYDKGIRRSIPKLLVGKFIEIVSYYFCENEGIYEDLSTDPEYVALKRFWLKCCLNPNAQSAEDLYEFLEKHNMKIDNHGNFYAYRRVVSIKQDVDRKLIDFIGNAYNKVKAVWKKKPSDYYIIGQDDGEYTISKNSKSDGICGVMGNLEKLYLDLPNMAENRYTDSHTNKMDYRIGQIASIPRNEGDDDNSRSCSKGLHIASKEYDYHGFGDTPILVIVNPIDVLAAPLSDLSKLRTCRWFFATTLPEDERHILEDEDFDVSELGDIFEEQCSEDLVNYVHNSIAEEVKRHTFSIPQMTGHDIVSLVGSLEKMKEIIEERIDVID